MNNSKFIAVKIGSKKDKTVIKEVAATNFDLLKTFKVDDKIYGRDKVYIIMNLPEHLHSHDFKINIKEASSEHRSIYAIAVGVEAMKNRITVELRTAMRVPKNIAQALVEIDYDAKTVKVICGECDYKDEKSLPLDTHSLEDIYKISY